MKKNILFIILTFFALHLKSELINVPDWDNEIYSIQAGIEISADGDTVLVAPGTYYENINFLGKKITVASEYLISGDEEDIEDTIIDGGGDDSVVRMESGEDTLSYLCGFVIRNGNYYRGGGIRIFRSGAKLEHLKVRNNISESTYHPCGGGIFVDGDIYNMIHPTWQDIIIRNVEISNNTVIGNSPYGGGINLCSGINLVVMDNVTITSNHCEGGTSAIGGGGEISTIHNVIMNSCEISNNSVSGSNSASCGGLSFLYIDNMLIDNCEISGNSVESDWSAMGGLGITTDGNVIIQNSLIADNSVLGFSSSGAGGATLSVGNFLVENCVIRDNSAVYYNGEPAGAGGMCFGQNCQIVINKTQIFNNFGGRGAAIAAKESSCLLINSVVSNNHSEVNGGFRIDDGGYFRIVNTIFWDNENCDFWIENPLYLDIYHSIIEEGEDGIECYGGADYFWGEGNLESYPLFIDAANGDFHLQEGSPGIDSGMCAYLDWDYNTHLIPEEEIIGRHRDIGVFETGIEDIIFDLPAYLLTDEDTSISLDLEDYLGGLSGDITIYNEDHLQNVITGNLITWQPDENWFGFDEVWIDLETNTGETYSDYIFIDVTGINDAPEINLPESISFNNIGHFSFDVLQYIFDAEGVLLDISTAGSEHINTWVNTPYLSLEAEPGWQGTETITVYAEDEWQRVLSSDTMQVIVYCEPVADCGDDLYGRDGAQVTLDGSLSLDPLLNGLSYQWSSDSELEIENADEVLAIANMPETEEMAGATIYLEVNDGYNSSIDSLYLTWWDDEPQDVECDMFPASDLIRIFWNAPAAVECEQIELLGYQMYFEGCEYDSLQNVSDLIYSFNLPEGDYNFGVQAVYSDGASDIIEVSSTDADESELVAVTGLNKIYPNPFNPETTISFSTTEDAEDTELTIYNIKGQRIRELKIEDGRSETGNVRRSVVWDGKDDKGHSVGSGMYFVRLKINNELFTKKVVLIK